MNTVVNPHFIHEISQLDRIRQQGQNPAEAKDALRTAATQFEALFTQRLFSSMRKANEAFESNLLDNRTTKLYQQLADEQLASQLSTEGALGLADLIVEQFAMLNDKTTG